MNTNVQKTEMTKEKRMEGMHNDISSFAYLVPLFSCIYSKQFRFERI